MAEALWVDELRERTLVERRVSAARLAMADDFDMDLLPDVDTALTKFYGWLESPLDSADDLTPEDERRLAVGLNRKR